MSKPSQQKRERQRKKAITRERKNRAFRQRADTAARFPEIIYKEDGAPEPFVDAVKSTLKEIVADHESILPKHIVRLFQRAKLNGFETVLTEIRAASRAAGHAEIQPGGATLDELTFFNHLGTLLFERLPREKQRSYLPFNDVRMSPGRLGDVRVRDTQISAQFRSLEQRKTSDGTAYFSPRRPTIEINGKGYTVAFYRHAVERICQRVVYDWETYEGFGDAFAFFHDCVYFEASVLPKGGDAFAIYNLCAPGFFTRRYVDEVLGTADSDKRYYYRVGYCPVVLVGDFIVAKTLLIPGMEGTPECDQYLKRMGRSPKNRDILRQQVERLTYHALVETQDFSLIKSFHEAGISQVVAIDDEVFRYRGTT